MSATGMIIDGIAASEAIDSSGEILDVDGCDISSFESGDGLLNFEHRGEDAPGASGLDVVGRITYAKKIFKRDDCENDRQRMYWDKVKLPYIYIIGRLYDGADHAGAKALAAIIRDHFANNEPIQVRFSIEGSTLLKEDNRLKRSVARRCALTLKPCNKSAISGLVEDPNAPAGFDKAPASKRDILADIGKSEHQHPMYTRLGGHTFEGSPLLEDSGLVLYKAVMKKAVIEQMLQKAYTGGSYNAAPGSLSGGAALQREDRGLSARVKKAIQAYDFSKNWKKAEFAAYLKHQLPEADDSFIGHFADLVDDYRVKKSEELEERYAQLAKQQAGFDFGAPPADGPKPKKPKAKKVGEVAQEDEIDPDALAIPEEVKEEEGQGPLTIRGNPVQPNPNLDKVHFDESTGILHTKRGSFPMYIPSRDSPAASKSFHEILNDPKVSDFHGYAMENWARLHSLLKAGKVPPEVVMHATLFSQLSPNTPVPIQELMYGHLVDSMRHTGLDARDPRFESIKEDWAGRDRGDSIPEHSREYFQNLDSIRVGKRTGMKDLFTGKDTFSGSARYQTEPVPGQYPARRKVLDEKGQPILIRKPGDTQSFMLANNKFASMAAYHNLHDSLVDLVKRHRGDARSAVQELMAHKQAAILHENKRKVAVRNGKPDPGPYTAGPAVQGLAPKTSRYMWGMIGGGNVTVPDTHFARYLFGLDKEKDADAIAHIKNTLWDPNNTEALNAIDRYYAKHHDAMQHMLTHPKYGHLFETPEDAIFPAFWKNWVAINPHERARGFGNFKTSNEVVDHRPFWEAVDPYVQLARSEDDMPFPAQTAVQHARWQEQYGEIPAMFLYHRFVVPRLLDAAEERQKMGVTLKAEEVFEKLHKDEGTEHPKGDAKGLVGPNPKVKYPAQGPEELANPKVVDRTARTTGMDVHGRLTLPSGTTVAMHFPREGQYATILHPEDYNHSDENFQHIYESVHDPWERAMENWLPLNKALREGKLPKGVLKKAVLFSAMSPNTSVPMQERHYGHLMDMINEGKLDLNKQISEAHVREFEKRATSGELPKWNRSYYEVNAPRPGDPDEEGEDEEKEKGELPQIQGLRYFDRLIPTVEDLVSKHKANGRAMASMMMHMKAEHKRAKNRGDEAPDHASIHGYGPKLTRYALAMMGAGNIVVPDRHFVRSIFNRSLEDPHLPALTGVVRKANNEKILQAMDQHFFERHPAVKYVLNRYPDHFKDDPQQAIFPAFWLHWLVTPHYERALGRENKGFNGGTDHKPFWDSIRAIMKHHGVPISDEHDAEPDFKFGLNKSEGHPLDTLHRVLQAVEAVRQKHGEAAAGFAYYLHALPALRAAEPLMEGAESLVRKFEAMAIDLRKAAAEAKAGIPKVVHFNGAQVVPGTAVVPHTGQEYALFEDRGDHYVGVPSEQSASWEPEHLVKLPKAHLGKKFDVVRAPRDVGDTHIIDSTQHAIPAFTRMKEQHMLIHGVDTSKWGAKEPKHAAVGEGEWVKAGGGVLAYAKDHPRARYEALFHDLAHEAFGLGQHVPLTAIFRHPKNGAVMSIQKAVVGARHASYRFDKAARRQIPIGAEADVLKRLGDNGTLDKLAMMDAVMGQTDRHDGNYVFTPGKGSELHLIDNERLFGNTNWGMNVPDYLRHYGHLHNVEDAKMPVHPDAMTWALSLDPGKLERAMHERGVKESRIIDTTKRLLRLQAVFRAQPEGLLKSHIPVIAEGE